jgi:hypothetical protein
MDFKKKLKEELPIGVPEKCGDDASDVAPVVNRLGL